jgi:hypothetical protein
MLAAIALSLPVLAADARGCSACFPLPCAFIGKSRLTKRSELYEIIHKGATCIKDVTNVTAPRGPQMANARQAGHRPEPVRIINPDGQSPFVLICDHASNAIPQEFGSLGLPAADLDRHIAWDPGAAPVARRMAKALDAVLVESGISRLVVDCNRPADAPDLIAAAPRSRGENPSRLGAFLHSRLQRRAAAVAYRNHP